MNQADPVTALRMARTAFETVFPEAFDKDLGVQGDAITPIQKYATAILSQMSVDQREAQRQQTPQKPAPLKAKDYVAEQWEITLVKLHKEHPENTFYTSLFEQYQKNKELLEKGLFEYPTLLSGPQIEKIIEAGKKEG
jgi:hypothetical protein